MFRNTVSAAVIAAFGLASVPALAATTVKEVDVTADISAMANQQAAAYWARVADDLENAIVARVTDRVDKEKGAKVSVDIDELSLANSFEAAANIEESSLAGQVSVTSDNGANKVGVYDMKVSFDQAFSMMPTGTDRTAVLFDSPEYYAAMINAFADAVVLRLD
ncbi:MAG: hypothetical protein DI533_06085 [Cereibacter sphaeroides]|uniref:Uncharacterized protein n=1 Tax=Cereibacter sphaeroides TaxID=1063 RepID=A0A2W5TVN9_CERSP|nr:MAG: hypothetical protein DI533_06085 [Cereibacter sphaeroides]